MPTGTQHKDRTIYRSLTTGDDLDCYQVRVKETDLWVKTSGSFSEDIISYVLHLRYQLERYIEKSPDFATSITPVEEDELMPEIALLMSRAAKKAGVGPMAAVAGAISEMVGRMLSEKTGEVIVENGGDIFVNCRRDITVGIYAGDSPLSNKIGIKLKKSGMPAGVCTSSGTIGHSYSMGRADAVVILSASAALSDAAATAVGNRILSGKDIPAGIEAAKNIKGVTGALIIVGNRIGAWGQVELTEI